MFDKRLGITYLGSKRRLLQRVHDCICGLKSSGKILDLFSGSGIVAAYLRYQGYEVHANDIAPYSYIVNKSNLEFTKKEIEKRYPNLNETVHTLNKLSEPEEEFYFSKYYSQNSEADCERLFYTRRNGLFLDAVLEQMGKWDDADLRCLILSNLLLKMSKHVNTSGVFKGCYKEFGGAGKNSLARITADIKIDVPVCLPGRVGKAYRTDAQAFLSQTEERFDVIYLDPPYNQHQYSANYHLLEYACRPFSERYIPTSDQVSGIQPDLYKSPYCSKKKCLEEMKKTLKFASKKCSNLVISYNENGHISKNEMVTILEEVGKVSVQELDYVNFRGGRNRKQSKNSVTEYLFVVLS